MNPQDLLRTAINQTTIDLAAIIPVDRSSAILALLRAVDRLPAPTSNPRPADPFTGIPVPGIGASRALQILLEAPPSSSASAMDLDSWATGFLDHCGDIARAELVLAHAETGFMRLLVDGHGRLEARIVQRATPLRWRERADDAWWANWLEAHEPLPAEPPRARASALIARTARRHDLPLESNVAGIDLGLARRVLAELALFTAESVTMLDRSLLVTRLALATSAPEPVVSDLLDILTLDDTNAAWHAAVPGVVDPPLVRLPNGKLVVSRRGATVDPVRFLTRELRRRDPEAYHSAAAYREHAFRSDLYDLFSHRRFVTSPGSIELRREKGTIRTDIDAAIFDRKSGTLALFELKTNEPFARSTPELGRTQENVRAAARQVANILDWINRHGPDEILNRIDRQTAKTFKVQKVQAFVLGRHLIEGDDRRAVWATWPQLLRVLDGDAIEDLGSNPIMSLAGRLQRDQPLVSPRDVREPVIVNLGGLDLVVRPLR